jgi:hypothetical protein
VRLRSASYLSGGAFVATKVIGGLARVGRSAAPGHLVEELLGSVRVEPRRDDPQGDASVAAPPERDDLTMEAAFDALRRHARDHNLKLTDVATAVVTEGLDPIRR